MGMVVLILMLVRRKRKQPAVDRGNLTADAWFCHINGAPTQGQIARP